MNNKVYLTTKVLPLIANYGRELKMGADIRRKRWRKQQSLQRR